MGIIVDKIADLGISVSTDKINNKAEEAELRIKINSFIESKKMQLFDMPVEEEIDFQGLMDYLSTNALDDFKTRFFDSNRITRGNARRDIINKALAYSKANTKLQEKRVIKIVGEITDILHKFYESRINRELLFVGNKIVDELSTEIHDIEKFLNNKIEDSKELSASGIRKLAIQNDFATIGNDINTVFGAIQSIHPLSTYYGVDMVGDFDQKQFVSKPRMKEALVKYPPQIRLKATDVSIAGIKATEISGDIFRYSYEHQASINLFVEDAKQYLGDIPDPFQWQADSIIGKKIELIPPEFPEAKPYSIYIDGQLYFEYLLMRVFKIENNIIYMSNEEQENRDYDVNFILDMENSNIRLNIKVLTNRAKNWAHYYRFVKNTVNKAKLQIKMLDSDKLLGEGISKDSVDIEDVDKKLELFNLMDEVEHEFNIEFDIPQDVTIGEYNQLKYLSDLINKRENKQNFTSCKFTHELSEQIKSSLLGMENIKMWFQYELIREFNIFGSVFKIKVLRKFESVIISDFEKLKKKLDILDFGDNITFSIEPSEEQYAYYTEELLMD